MNLVSIREHGNSGEHGLDLVALDRLDNAAREDQRLQRNEGPLVRVGRDGVIRAGGLVGFLQTGALSVEVFPKYVARSNDTLDAKAAGEARANFIGLLDFCRVYRTQPGLPRQLATEAGSLAEFMLHGMAGRLRSQLRRGVKRAYIEREEALEVVRGRILLDRQLIEGRGLPIPMRCRYERHESNTPLARLLALHALLLARRSRWSATRRIAAQATHMLPGVWPSRAYERDRAKVHFNRGNQRFEPCVRDLELLVGRRRHDIATQHRTPSWALSWDMGPVFERYVERVLKRTLPQDDPLPAISVVGQDRVGYLASEPGEEEFKVFQQKPDIVATVGDERTVIIDAKYKRPTNFRPSESDVRQVLAYAELWNRQRRIGDEPFCDRVVLLYPRPWQQAAADGPPKSYDLFAKVPGGPRVGKRVQLVIATIEFGADPTARLGEIRTARLGEIRKDIAAWML